jgi:quinol monooxygenase YgiN/mannose-6-phosphate isomerase-like protein (cupin superfamily)
MAGVARCVKMTAREGEGEALAQLLLRVADGLRGSSGCEQYVINRSLANADQVWVVERWLSQEALDASLEQLQGDSGKAQLAEVMALLDGPPERIDLQPLGGVGYLPGGTGSTILNLEDVEDQAPRFGLGEAGEARFATGALGARATGVSHQRVRPGVRQAFGHRHHHAEELYFVLAGGGRVNIDGEIRDVRTLDAIRVAPQSTRAFEAGPDGLELLVVGERHPGDVEVDRDFWPV